MIRPGPEGAVGPRGPPNKKHTQPHGLDDSTLLHVWKLHRGPWAVGRQKSQAAMVLQIQCKQSADHAVERCTMPWNERTSAASQQARTHRGLLSSKCSAFEDACYNCSRFRLKQGIQVGFKRLTYITCSLCFSYYLNIKIKHMPACPVGSFSNWCNLTELTTQSCSLA